MEETDKRKEGRARADRLRAKYEEVGDPLMWFDEIYKEAEGDPALVPWGHLEARFPLLNWLERQERPKPGTRALDVGTGFGDNAAALCRAGYDVTAFDLSPTAVDWAAQRFANLPIRFVAANLLSPPDEWVGAFDLVSETFTVQALKGDDRQKAFASLAALVRIGGQLLIVARGRLDDEPLDPPPWPMTPSELDKFKGLSFKETLREEYFDKKDPPRRHFLAAFTRVEDV